ncbi:MAG: methyltransferase domain-containing protein [Candidatus Delongbacteria bacterium]|jgi:SAM-dependent methyltransferase|nr:methyltransferase domain-containing protein [Candidatus Delongbacteria bacterium]
MRKFMRFLVRKVPRPVLIRFSYVFRWLILPFYMGNKYECPVCGKHFCNMLPYGNKGEANRLCPRCLSLERHRLMWLFLQSDTNFFTEKLKVLHVAPEQPFLPRFKKLKNLDYVTGDLYSPIADVKMDVMDMPFEDNAFDVVICNHVLEHVTSDIKAMKEIWRVLNPGGWAMLQVPINYNNEKTIEDLSITDPKERERIFGQYDHVRWHGLDYADRLHSVGFQVDENHFLKSFSPEQRDIYRFPEKETIFVASKSRKEK